MLYLLLVSYALVRIGGAAVSAVPSEVGTLGVACVPRPIVDRLGCVPMGFSISQCLSAGRRFARTTTPSSPP